MTDPGRGAQESSSIPDQRLDAQTELEGCQLVMLRILRVFDCICGELGLSYWLDSGTLLGAVRHGGFIPWDDDLDVAMMQEDYQKFLAQAPELLPANLFLQHRGSDPDYDLPFAKLMDRYSLLDSPDGVEGACMSGIFIDIQPMDSFTDRQRNRRKLLYVLKGDYGRHDPARSLPRRAKRGLLGLFRAGCRGLGLDRAIFSFLARGEGRWIAYDLSFQRWWPSFHAPEAVFPLKRLSFEGFEFPVPADTDAYLRTQFGSYMELPPVELRRPVHAGGIHLTGPNLHREGLPWPGRA